MKIVIDCNVLISAGLKNGLCREVLKKSLDRGELYLSTEVIVEYLLVSRRDKLKAHQPYLEKLIEAIVEGSSLIKPTPSPFILPDPYDQKYVDLAISAEANFLITGNLKDFPERAYGRTIVFSPREFLAVLST